MTFFSISFEEFQKLMNMLSKYFSALSLKNFKNVDSNFRIYLKGWVEPKEEYVVVPLKHYNKKIIILISITKDEKERFVKDFLLEK